MTWFSVHSLLRRKADPVYSEPLNISGLSWRLKVYPVSMEKKLHSTVQNLMFYYSIVCFDHGSASAVLSWMCNGHFSFLKGSSLEGNLRNFKCLKVACKIFKTTKVLMFFLGW